MTGEMHMVNTNDASDASDASDANHYASPMGLGWTRTNANNWIYRINGLAICHIMRSFTTLDYVLYECTGGQGHYTTLQEAKAVANAIIAMRDK